MNKVPFSINKFHYNHHGHQKESPSRAIDIHEISISRSAIRVVLSYFITLLTLAISYYLLTVQDKLYDGSILGIIAFVIFAKFLQYKPVKKESVIIMRELGVQLETHYWSGKVTHRFVPIAKILRPVLNECVTPITCYWSLSLILHGEEQLMLVFQEVQPPLKMLVPVWKALIASMGREEASSL